MTHLSTDVLVVGAGGAGMYAAIAAAREGSSVLLLDKNLIGRGGATIMAQMTVAAAIGHEEPDDWVLHLEDTLEAGRGICNEPLSAMVCQRGPERILEMDRWGTRWAREDGTYQTGRRTRSPPQTLLLRRFSEHRPGRGGHAAQAGQRHGKRPPIEQRRRH